MAPVTDDAAELIESARQAQQHRHTLENRLGDIEAQLARAKAKVGATCVELRVEHGFTRRHIAELVGNTDPQADELFARRNPGHTPGQ